MVQEITPQHFGNVSHTHRGPGWPDLAFCTASMLRARSALAHWRRVVFVVFISLYPRGLQHLLNLLFQFHLIDSKQSDPFR